MFIIFLQMIICMTVPCFMILYGRYRKSDPPLYKTKSMLSMFKKADSSEDVWLRYGALFYNLIFTSGINVGIITLIFFTAVIVLFGPNWIMCITFFIAQLFAGFGMSFIVTALIINRLNDDNGDKDDTAAEAEKCELSEESADSVSRETYS